MSKRQELIDILTEMKDEEFEMIKAIDTTHYWVLVVDGEETPFMISDEEQKEELMDVYTAAGKTIEFREVNYRDTAFKWL